MRRRVVLSLLPAYAVLPPAALRAQTAADANSNTLSASAITLQLISLLAWWRSRHVLERSVWWYNRELPRP